MTSKADTAETPPIVEENRAAEIAAAYSAIRAEVEKLRGLYLGETHPAVIFCPIPKKPGQ